jgi:hypothetical protein
MAKPRVPANLQAWVEARRRYQLSDAHVQMARELGMNPNKLGGLANHRQEKWKAPLPDFIEVLYERRFGRRRPERIRSIEDRAAELTQKKALRRQRRAADRRHGAKLRAVNKTGDTTMSQVSARQMNVSREAATVLACAAAQEARVISLGPLLFFSSETGDAWVLEPADRLARCLGRAGVALPTGIVETPDTFSIEWQATYALDGEVFIVAEGDGRVTTIVGYPVDAIRHVMELVEAG